MRIHRLIVTLTACAAVATTAAPAQATFPGIVNGRLAFGSAVDGNVDVYSVMPNGTAIHRLTDAPAFDACPAYSADGKHIAWCSAAGGRGGPEIWTMRANGHDKRQLTDLGAAAVFPTWSPSGNEIAFMANPPGAQGFAVYVVDATDGAPRMLTDAPGADTFPSWSPDGARIAFVSERSGSSQVWTIATDGTDARQLTTDTAVKGQRPDWSADGSHLVYETEDPLGVDLGADLWTIRPDGTDRQRLTSDAVPETGPAWSPDGSSIAYLNVATRTTEILDLSTGARRAVAPFGLQFVPAWQPRGQRLR